MRKLKKRSCPPILEEKASDWLNEYLADKSNETKRIRYRHDDIKDELRKETSWKCVYCESKIGHNSPGDVEHKIPTHVDSSQHFTWENLTVACTECNRRKNATYDAKKGFLDPYSDPVESLIIHQGPIAVWKLGNVKAETAIRILALHNYDRFSLLELKIKHLNDFINLVERYRAQRNPTLKECLRLEVEKAKAKDSPYSAMVIAYANSAGI